MRLTKTGFMVNPNKANVVIVSLTPPHSEQLPFNKFCLTSSANTANRLVRKRQNRLTCQGLDAFSPHYLLMRGRLLRSLSAPHNGVDKWS